MEFAEQLQEDIVTIEHALDQYLTVRGCSGQEKIVEAMRYSLLSGGKRLRPVLTMEFCRASGGQPELAVPFACALEMIHTYSLIHDDLPCMDNDDLRRGKPTNHKVYGEGFAVLAGDALLTYAFETITHFSDRDQLQAGQIVDAIHILAHESGYYGMIGGQVLDLAAEHTNPTFEELANLQDKKTGGLIRAAVKMGCTLGKASSQQLQAAQTYADRLGLAFQIQDDILDIEGDESVFGKPIGSDLEQGKATFPALIGIQKCKEMVRSLTDEAIAAIHAFNEPQFLIQLANSMVGRTK
mgnify:FL=1